MCKREFNLIHCLGYITRFFAQLCSQVFEFFMYTNSENELINHYRTIFPNLEVLSPLNILCKEKSLGKRSEINVFLMSLET